MYPTTTNSIQQHISECFHAFPSNLFPPSKNHDYVVVLNAIVWIAIHRIEIFLGIAVLCVRSVVSYLSRTWGKKEGSTGWKKDLG